MQTNAQVVVTVPRKKPGKLIRISIGMRVNEMRPKTIKPYRLGVVWRGGFKPALIVVVLVLTQTSLAQEKPRARNLGIPFEGTPGPLNGITDVNGVEIGHTTLISGEGPLRVGVGPIRTGATAILPRGKQSDAPVFAGWFSLNGTGEMTGTTFIEEYGLLEGPILLTNSQSVGTVRDAVSAWLIDQKKWKLCCLPVVAETHDGFLNDINGFHVKPADVLRAINGANSGSVSEGNVGGGTGMVAFGFKKGDRNCLQKAGSGIWWLHRRDPSASEFWAQESTSDRGSTGRPGAY